MSHFRVYIKPFDSSGAYAADWTEVSEDVARDSMGEIRQMIDDSDYDVGVFKFNDFNLKLRNIEGLYGDADTIKSMFRYKRTNSLVKITWQLQEDDPYPGMVYPAASVAGNDEVEVFQGLLNDEGTDADIRDQDITFRVLGRESVFAQVETPFGDLSIGDTVAEVIFACLNQPKITDLLTVDIANITPQLDLELDAVAHFENTAVFQVLEEMFKISGSVMTIIDDVIYVSERTETAALQKTFYGQASNAGIEDVINITGVRSGINRTFNYLTWAETTLLAQDVSSVARLGIKKRPQDMEFDSITDTAKRQQILDMYRDEFGNPKAEFDLTVPITKATLQIPFLGKVAVDYPTILYPAAGEPMPIYGLAIYGQSFYPHGVWSLTLATTDLFKVMGRGIKTKDHHIIFRLRGV